MRLRNVKGSDETIEASKYSVNTPESCRGKWREAFGNDGPLHVEIGMGKGKFITALAQLHPEINYIGIEKFSSVLVRAIEKMEELELENLLFIRMDAEKIEEVFAEGEVNRIYLNFSDPWPKDRHAKRRLTSRRFLERYDRVLKEDGQIEFKTDNRMLFDFSLEEILQSDFVVAESSYDLHHSAMGENNVMTEYEEKFSSQGNPIHKLIAKRKRDVQQNAAESEGENKTDDV